LEYFQPRHSKNAHDFLDIRRVQAEGLYFVLKPAFFAKFIPMKTALVIDSDHMTRVTLGQLLRDLDWDVSAL
jgi:hypothetical protein